jgi:hypothetical protein
MQKVAMTSNLVKNNECNVTYVLKYCAQCQDVVPNASFTRHDVYHDCSVEEVKIVIRFINQIEYVSIGILISKLFDCVHSLLLCMFKVKTLKFNEKVQIFPS